MENDWKRQTIEEFNTVRNLYLFMQKLLQETVWDDGNSYAVENAFLKQPKITTPVIKAICAAIKQNYLEINEPDINFFNVLDGLVVMRLAVWQVNTMMKNKIDGLLFSKNMEMP